MKTFLLLLSIAVLGSSKPLSEGRFPRQIWPTPPYPDPFGPGPGSPSFGQGPVNPSFGDYDNGVNSFGDGITFGRPTGGRGPNGNQGTFFDDGGRNDFLFNGGQNNNQGGGRPSNQGGGRPNNQGGGRPNNQGGGRPNNQGGGRPNNQRTTTTESTTSTQAPRTIHTSPQGCACPSTPQFNPVCGSDGNTYKNAGLLNCYRQCGTNVSQRRLGSC